MSELRASLEKRSNNACELCGSSVDLSIYEVPPHSKGTVNDSVFVCQVCSEQINQNSELDKNHWHCLNESMWSEHDAVKVVSWRMLNRLKTEVWAQDLLEMIYLDDESLKWAAATGENLSEDEKIIHKDSNGVRLENGDNVVLIKDLNVKGGGFTAKRGTAVRRITLDPENATYIEGKVEGQRIVILTQYVKKT
ncbi:PhnA domain-containing protein [Crocinitomix algicola]|uniref:PhnA domain-containing protein n=1 Tax=Crocinitomix algicola TaxID=1740263 RepID=UPI000829B408|nr:alkylphosphonate utilization protein [Crocinitomix algicola]